MLPPPSASRSTSQQLLSSGDLTGVLAETTTDVTTTDAAPCVAVTAVPDSLTSSNSISMDYTIPAALNGHNISNSSNSSGNTGDQHLDDEQQQQQQQQQEQQQQQQQQQQHQNGSMMSDGTVIHGGGALERILSIEGTALLMLNIM